MNFELQYKGQIFTYSRRTLKLGGGGRGVRKPTRGKSPRFFSYQPPIVLPHGLVLQKQLALTFFSGPNHSLNVVFLILHNNLGCERTMCLYPVRYAFSRYFASSFRTRQTNRKILRNFPFTKSWRPPLGSLIPCRYLDTFFFCRMLPLYCSEAYRFTALTALTAYQPLHTGLPFPSSWVQQKRGRKLAGDSKPLNFVGFIPNYFRCFLSVNL